MGKLRHWAPLSRARAAGGKAAAQHGQLRPEIRQRNGRDDDDGGDELSIKAGISKPQGDGIDQAETNAQDHPDDAPAHAAAAQEGRADEQRRQGDGHHAGTDVDVDGFLRLGQQQPDRPVKALATQRPTMVVKTGLIDDERTMSGLFPVARMARPSFVFKNRPREDGDEKSLRWRRRRA